MYRRVVVPALLALVVPLAVVLYHSAWGLYSRRIIDAALGKQGDLRAVWLPPALPTGWLLFLAIFFAVRLCVLRGGSRRDCLLVALSPALIGGVVLVASGIHRTGMSWSLLALGSMRPFLTGAVTVGTAMTVHDYVGYWLGLVATAVGALWLYLFVARHPLKLPAAAAGVTSPDEAASAQTVA